MNPINTTIRTGFQLATESAKPVIATLRTRQRIFNVRCEYTGYWIRPSPYDSFTVSEKNEIERIKKIYDNDKHPFYILKEENGVLKVTRPLGYWLKDGRLVYNEYDQLKDRVKGFYGSKSEILSMNRSVKYILDGSCTFLPDDEEF